MFGENQKITKNNLLKGIPWRFGPNWPGKTCVAKTRKGTPCQRPAKLPVGRCRLHGGASTGPRTKDGLKRLADSKTIHGRFTKLEREKAKARAEQGRIIRRELKELETWFIDNGYLKKNWRKDWDDLLK
ncbi:MAG: hypothetical protein CBC53_007395 [Alphaproteobacteria bacterium TMED93]|nr:MAG: hypothetical protein CBC53_007395 [Alphaproteobacteria bacterium TMED93]